MIDKKRIIIFGIIALLVFTFIQPTEEEKKEGFSVTRLLMGVGLVALGLFVLPVGGMGIPVFAAGLIFLRYTYIKDVVIPSWVWIVGFFVLALMAMRKK